MRTFPIKTPEYFILAFPAVVTGLVLLATGAYAAAPSVSLIANPSTIERGQATALIWNASNADHCVASGGWSGYLSTSNSANAYPQVTTEYGINCNGADGIATARVTVSVISPSAIPPTTYYSNSTVTQTSSPAPVYYTPPSAPAFTAACAASSASAPVGRSITFGAASSGGASPVRYQWIGDVTGIGQTQTISFSSTGTKTASVTVVDANNRTAVGTCRVEITEAVVSAPASTPKVPVATVASAKIEAPDYEKICLEKGFVKPSAEVAEGTGEETPEVAAAATSRFSGAAFLPLLLLSNLFFVLVTAYFTYRFTKKAARKNQGTT